MNDPRIGFVGAGTLGNGLAMACASVGQRVVAVASRSPASAEALASRVPGSRAYDSAQEVADACDLVFITTPDEAIGSVVSDVRWRPAHGVAHCSGAHSLDVLEAASAQSASVGSLHPYQTFACLDTHGEAAARLRGATVCVDGDGWLLGFLDGLAVRLGARALRVDPKNRALYHASAVMACGHLVSLLSAACDLWESMGVTREEALHAVLPLAGATLSNVSRHGLSAGFTGPVARADLETLRRHLEAIESGRPGLAALYRELAWGSLALSNADEDTRETMAEIIVGRRSAPPATEPVAKTQVEE